MEALALAQRDALSPTTAASQGFCLWVLAALVRGRMATKSALLSLSQLAAALKQRPSTLSWSELHLVHQGLLQRALRARDAHALWLLSQFYERGFHSQWRLLGQTRPRGNGLVSRFWSRVRRRVNALLTEPLLSLDIYLAEQYRYAAARAGFVQAQLAVIAKLRLAGDDADHELAYALLKRVAAIALKSQSDEADPAIVLPQLGLTCLARGELADALSYLEHWYGRVRAPNRQADAVAVLGILYVRRWLQSGQPKTDHDRVRARRCLEEAATKGSVLAEPWLVYAEELWTGPRPSTDRSVAAPVASH